MKVRSLLLYIVCCLLLSCVHKKKKTIILSKASNNYISWIEDNNLIILDAQNVSDGPVATAQLPHRIPYGFHGWYENRS